MAILEAPWEDLLDVLGKSQVVEVNLEHAILRARDRPLRWVFPQPQPPWQHQPPYPTPPQGPTPESSPFKGYASASAAAAAVPSTPAHAPAATAVKVQPTAKNSHGGSGSTKNHENRNHETQTKNLSSDNGKHAKANAVGKDAAPKATEANVPDDAATDGDGHGSDGDSSEGAVGFACSLQGARKSVAFI